MKSQPTQIELIGRDKQKYEFLGVLLGSSTSQTYDHTGHADRFARRGEKCSACRWFEVAIYRRYWIDAEDRAAGIDYTHDGPHDYVVHTVGGSSVAGEKRFSRVQGTTSPYDVIELLTVRPVDRDPFIASQSARALAQAADVDRGIRDAYINRAVV